MGLSIYPTLLVHFHHILLPTRAVVLSGEEGHIDAEKTPCVIHYHQPRFEPQTNRQQGDSLQLGNIGSPALFVLR